MDTKTVADGDILKCALCNKYLTVPPVFCLNLEGDQYRCGRCKDVECEIFSRNICYENVAKYLSFPCAYEQCEEKIPWEQVEDHEKTCPYRTVSCAWWNCNKTLQISELKSHFEQNHLKYVMYGEAVFSANITGCCVCLLVKDEQPYFIYYMINEAGNGEEHIFVSVLSLSLQTCSTKFDVELASNNNSYFIACKNQDVMALDDKQHCITCMAGVCNKKYHPYSQLYNKRKENLNTITTKFEKESVLKILEGPKMLQITITLMDNN